MKRLKHFILVTASLAIGALFLIYYLRHKAEKSLCDTYIDNGKTALYLTLKYKQDTGDYPEDIKILTDQNLDRIFYKRRSSKNQNHPYLGVFYDEIYNDIVIHYDFEQKTWISIHDFKYYKCAI